MARCPFCGCETQHYNSARLRMECDLCGAPVSDSAQQSERMAFDRSFALANAHLAAGGWDRALGTLRPLLEQRPNEKKLHVAVFRSATQDLEDLACENGARREAASAAWDSLRRLRGLTPEIVRYGRRKRALRKQRLRRQRSACLAWLFAAAACALVSGLTTAMDGALWVFPVAFQSAFYYCLYRFFRSHPVRVMKKLLVRYGDCDNPFTLEQEDAAR